MASSADFWGSLLASPECLRGGIHLGGGPNASRGRPPRPHWTKSWRRRSGPSPPAPSPPKHALDRIFVEHWLPAGPNPFTAAGIPGAFGYWFPMRRQLELFAALQDHEPDPTQGVLRPIGGPLAPNARVLAMLYNVRVWRHHERDGMMPVPLRTLGPAWFPQRWHSVDTVKVIGETLLARAGQPELIRDEALIEGPAPTAIEPGCEGAVGGNGSHPGWGSGDRA